MRGRKSARVQAVKVPGAEYSLPSSAQSGRLEAQESLPEAANGEENQALRAESFELGYPVRIVAKGENLSAIDWDTVPGEVRLAANELIQGWERINPAFTEFKVDTCLRQFFVKQRSKWSKTDGKNAACRTCSGVRQPCGHIENGQIVFKPLAASLRTSTDPQAWNFGALLGKHFFAGCRILLVAPEMGEWLPKPAQTLRSSLEAWFLLAVG